MTRQPTRISTKKLSAKQRGLTLIELLVVITILAILATLGLAVQRASVRAARVARTRTTIAKIDAVLSAMYEKYQYRKVDLGNYVGTNPGDTYRMRTAMLLDMLRMDMPTNIDEAKTGPLVIPDPSSPPKASALNQSYKPVVDIYQLRIDDIENRYSGGEKDRRLDELSKAANAELLYLIVTNSDPESRTGFHDREVGITTERGGGKVFVDGWGNPICFLRWAPGLIGSARQPTPVQVANYLAARSAVTAYDNSDSNYVICREFQQNFADPLNPLALSHEALVLGIANFPFPDDWLLVPLIYSYGPDGESGIVASHTFGVCNNPFDPTGPVLFSTLGDNSQSSATDNITNHNYYND